MLKCYVHGENFSNSDAEQRVGSKEAALKKSDFKTGDMVTLTKISIAR